MFRVLRQPTGAAARRAAPDGTTPRRRARPAARDQQPRRPRTTTGSRPASSTRHTRADGVVFLPSRLADNPHLDQAAYVDTLAAAPDRRARTAPARRLGDPRRRRALPARLVHDHRAPPAPHQHDSGRALLGSRRDRAHRRQPRPRLHRRPAPRAPPDRAASSTSPTSSANARHPARSSSSSPPPPNATGATVAIVIEQEPGAAGKAVTDRYKRHVLRGYTVRARPRHRRQSTSAPSPSPPPPRTDSSSSSAAATPTPSSTSSAPSRTAATTTASTPSPAPTNTSADNPDAQHASPSPEAASPPAPRSSPTPTASHTATTRSTTSRPRTAPRSTRPDTPIPNRATNKQQQSQMVTQVTTYLDRRGVPDDPDRLRSWRWTRHPICRRSPRRETPYPEWSRSQGASFTAAMISPFWRGPTVRIADAGPTNLSGRILDLLHDTAHSQRYGLSRNGGYSSVTRINA